DGLAALDEERLVVAKLDQRRDDRAERFGVARSLPGAAVDDELLRALGNLRIEVVEQHSERRLGRPGARSQLGPARCANRPEVAAERLDGCGKRAGGAHASSPT